MQNVQHIVLVLSGKGGVGKSTVTTELAVSLAKLGKRVPLIVQGVLDIDLTGPSLPEMFGLGSEQIHQSSEGWVPVYTDASMNLGVVSVGFLLGNKTDPVIWRGPKKSAMIKQFVEDISWGPLDYLLIDTPPGTSDEHISIVGHLKQFKVDGAVVVTTPQGVSLADVRREINFCKKVSLPILGLVENMSGFICPHCAECTALFSTGGGEALATELSIPFMGRVAIDPALTTLMETYKFPEAFSQSQLFEPFQEIVRNLQKACRDAEK
ncbi:Nucleotide-binding protein 2 [Kappamyces sp. JEL0829]|nr:Nucleotide-binding protein 2 [Kappamyces sp. JEL0829]